MLFLTIVRVNDTLAKEKSLYWCVLPSKDMFSTFLKLNMMSTQTELHTIKRRIYSTQISKKTGSTSVLKHKDEQICRREKCEVNGYIVYFR